MRHSFILIASLLLALSAPACGADVRDCTDCSVVADAIASASQERRRAYWSLRVQFDDLLDDEEDAGLFLHQREIEPASRQLDGFDCNWTIGLHLEIRVR
jgi:hypothetical protein